MNSLILQILRELSAQASFVILRNPEIFNAETPPLKDLDICVKKEDQKKTIRFFAERGFTCRKCLNHYEFTEQHTLTVAFDVQFGTITETNIPTICYDALISSSKEIEGLHILDGSCLLIHLVTHCMINKGFFKTEYRAAIVDELSSKANAQSLEQFLYHFFPAFCARKILLNLKHGDFKALSGSVFKYITLHLAGTPRNIPAFIKYAIRRCSHRLSMPHRGKVIAFIGLDGSGKTTVAKALIAALTEKGIKADYLYMGALRGHALPMHAMSQKIGVSKIQSKGKRPSILYRAARDGMYMLDLWMRYLFFIFPRLWKNRYVVCDRYAYSLFLDKNRTFISEFLLRFFYPRPSFLFFIETSEDEIIRRKNEFTREERAHHLNQWMKVNRLFGAKTIASENLNNMLKNIQHTIEVST